MLRVALILPILCAAPAAGQTAVLSGPAQAVAGQTITLQTFGSESDRPVVIAVVSTPPGVRVAVVPTYTPGPDGKFQPVGGWALLPAPGSYRFAAVAFKGDIVAVRTLDVQALEPPDVHPQPAPPPNPPPPPGPQPVPTPPAPQPPADGEYKIARVMYETAKGLDLKAVRSLASILERWVPAAKDYRRSGADAVQAYISAVWTDLRKSPDEPGFDAAAQALTKRINELSAENFFNDANNDGVDDGEPDVTRLAACLAEAAAGLRAAVGN